jgi:hypothetical protein
LSELPQQGTPGIRTGFNSNGRIINPNSEIHLVPVNAGNPVYQTAILPENPYERINSRFFTKRRNSERASERTIYDNTSTSEPPLPKLPIENPYDLALPGSDPATYEVAGSVPATYEVVERETGSRKKGLTRTQTVHIPGTVVYEEGNDSNEHPVRPIVAEGLYKESTIQPTTNLNNSLRALRGAKPIQLGPNKKADYQEIPA